MSYNWFAKVYDELMDDSLYSQWLQYTQKHLQPGATLLELGCGTGILGIMLKQAGYDLTGLDLSEEMLSLAYNRQLESKTMFPLLHRDMKDLSGLPPFDAMVCYSDALCYMESEESLKTVFKAVYNGLNKNGCFLFDVHSPLKITDFLETSFHAETNGIVFLWDSYEGEYPNSIEHQLTFFVENEEGLYERFEELHKERTYSLQTYQQLLKEAGFNQVKVTSDFQDSFDGVNGRRWFFEAVK
ncbi:Methyltransferase [Alkalibacterium sp. AK22]|uniref:class I SAM-dependent DNA methyltransferase n=1 Tax=Alkalibacterium sp. AK22 TaxID=1229520 RepID=UPI00044BCCB1|nr:class I SAM-dependent methyltransferase [Alkalibacterium sp. AK22]EXJ22865.1 Methyltransferase [Alkalibacterium sp. AK22]